MPGFRTKVRRGRVPRDNEDSRQVAILRFLNTCMGKTFAWTMETYGRPIPVGKGVYRLEPNPYGTGKPDIGGVTYGFGFVLEVKVPGNRALKRSAGRVRDNQADWMLDYRVRGLGSAGVVHDSLEAEQFIRSLWKEKGITPDVPEFWPGNGGRLNIADFTNEKDKSLPASSGKKEG